VEVYRGDAAEALSRSGSGPATPPSGRATAQSECTDTAYSTYSSKWTSQYNWYIKTSSFPDEIHTDNGVSGLKSAVANITHADNNCGMGDNVGATGSYKGSTDTGTNVNSSGGCASRDSKNVVGFGTLPSTMLALTCWWASGGSMLEADIRMNKASFLWVVNIGSNCVNKFSVQAVGTHEFGHAFGMAHVDEGAHGALTMSPTIRACQGSENTLGKGDVLGLQSKY
jgi:hypothetical protein